MSTMKILARQHAANEACDKKITCRCRNLPVFSLPCYESISHKKQFFKLQNINAHLMLEPFICGICSLRLCPINTEETFFLFEVLINLIIMISQKSLAQLVQHNFLLLYRVAQ